MGADAAYTRYAEERPADIHLPPRYEKIADGFAVIEENAVIAPLALAQARKVSVVTRPPLRGERQLDDASDCGGVALRINGPDLGHAISPKRLQDARQSIPIAPPPVKGIAPL